MKINLNQKLKDINGNELGQKLKAVAVEVKREGGQVIWSKPIDGMIVSYEDKDLSRTLKDELQNALMHNPKGELTGEEKSKRFKFWLKLDGKKEIELDNEELSFFQKCVGAYEQDVFLCGSVQQILESK